MNVLKIVASVVVGVVGFVWTVIQIMDYFGLTTKASIPALPVKNPQQQVVMPRDTTSPQKVKVKRHITHPDLAEDVPKSVLKAPFQKNVRELSGSCSYSITNDSSYSIRFILKHFEKKAGQLEMVKVFLPSKSNYSVNKLPEGTFSINYCIGNEWDTAKQDFNSLDGCKDATEILSNEVERKLIDGDIIKKKRCEESIRIGDDGRKLVQPRP